MNSKNTVVPKRHQPDLDIPAPQVPPDDPDDVSREIGKGSDPVIKRPPVFATSTQSQVGSLPKNVAYETTQEVVHEVMLKKDAKKLNPAPRETLSLSKSPWKPRSSK